MSAATAPKRPRQPKELSLRSMAAPQPRPFHCPHCDRRLRTPQALAQHVAAGHGRKSSATDEAATLAALRAEADTLRAVSDRALLDGEIDRLADRLIDVERRAVALRVTTLAGAAAALEWVRADLLLVDGTCTGFGFYPALIGQALDVLQRVSGAA